MNRSRHALGGIALLTLTVLWGCPPPEEPAEPPADDERWEPPPGEERGEAAEATMLTVRDEDAVVVTFSGQADQGVA